jgi:ferredoxin
VPKFKTHELTLLTGGIKNLFGLVPGTFKTELHKNYFHANDFAQVLVDIYQEAKPALTIIDGIVAMEGDGPASNGKLRELGLLLAGSDCVALDSVLAKIMGINPLDILTTKHAAERNLGCADLAEMEILGEELQNLSVRPFLLPSSLPTTKKLPKPVIKLAKKLVRYFPVSIAQNCIKCGACVQICPYQCVVMKNKGVGFNYKKCIACFCCQETCSSAAIRVKKSLLAKLIGL